MMKREYRLTLLTVLMGGLAATTSPLQAGADPIVFFNGEVWQGEGTWDDVIPEYTTIDFTGFESLVLFPNEYYSDLGVTFGGTNVTFHTSSFGNDGEGIWGQGDTWAYFDEPMNWLGVSHAGGIRFDLYLEDELVYSSGAFSSNSMSGVKLDQEFDSVNFYRVSPGDSVYIDDIYFGNWAMVPAPGAAILFGFAAFGARRRRRA